MGDLDFLEDLDPVELKLLMAAEEDPNVREQMNLLLSAIESKPTTNIDPKKAYTRLLEFMIKLKQFETIENNEKISEFINLRDKIVGFLKILGKASLIELPEICKMHTWDETIEVTSTTKLLDDWNMKKINKTYTNLTTRLNKTITEYEDIASIEPKEKDIIIKQITGDHPIIIEGDVSGNVIGGNINIVKYNDMSKTITTLIEELKNKSNIPENIRNECTSDLNQSKSFLKKVANNLAKYGGTAAGHAARAFVSGE